MHSKNLITSGILFSLILFLWPMFMAIAQPSGTDAEKLAWVMEHLVLYRLQFIFALLIAPSIIFMMGVHLSIIWGYREHLK